MRSFSFLLPVLAFHLALPAVQAVPIRERLANIFGDYAHLDRWPEGLTEGDPVDTRSVIGYAGNSGNARGTPPHPHFGIRAIGGDLNPLPLIRNPA